MIGLRVPQFWQDKRISPLSLFAQALSVPYHVATGIRRAFSKPTSFPKPIFCIGNVTVGGAGKTPLVIAISEALRGRGHRVAIVSRGYEGREKGPLQVDPSHHTYKDVGDEPLMMAQKGLEVWVSRNRPMGISDAFKAGADIVVMDDGFQNPTLAPSASLLVFDGTYGLGNERIFPAGPLREPLSKALDRAHGALILGHDVTDLEQRIRSQGAESFVLFSGIVQSSAEDVQDLSVPCLAFCGVGNPDKVFASFTKAGLNLVETDAFPDHHAYSVKELETLCGKAEELKAQLITTEKDMVRIPKIFHARIIAIPAKIEVDGGLDPLLTLLLGPQG